MESLPLGRRIAFDGAKGRLWVVCRRCERWNLTPLEERFLAIEECERMFRGTRLRVSTENIGLARLREGLELVRIGRPQRPEMVGWRYGDQFRRRQRRQLAYGSLAVAGFSGMMLGAAGAGIAAAAVLGAMQVVGFGQHVLANRMVRARFAVPGRKGVMTFRRVDVHRIALRADGDAWSVAIPWEIGLQGVFRPTEHVFTGEAALRAAAAVLPTANDAGASARRVDEALGVLADSRGVEDLFVRAARHDVRPGDRERMRDGSALRVETRMIDLPLSMRLALEVAAHEDFERRVLEGELAMLENAWRTAEEIATIADSLLLPQEADPGADARPGEESPRG